MQKTYSGFAGALDELILLVDKHWNDIIIEAASLWVDKPWNYALGALPSFEIQYILDGSAVIRMNNREYNATRGHFYFSDVSLPTSCEESSLRLYYITFTTHNQELYKEIKHCFTSLADCPQPADTGSMEENFTAFHYENSFEREYSRILARHTFVKILVTFHRALFLHGEKNERAVRGSRQEKLTGEIVKYLDANYQRVLELKDVASAYSLNPRYLNHTFKGVTGTTIMQYLNRLRCEKAKRLLLFTGMSITDIALDTGFCDCQHFCKNFKGQENLTPSEYRNSLRDVKEKLI